MSIADREFDFIRNLVYEHSRISLGPDKKELVAARVGKRLRKLNLADFKVYCDLLRSEKGVEEMDDLIDVIATNFTNFFREEEHFTFLREQVLVEFDARQEEAHAPFRVWSTACS